MTKRALWGSGGGKRGEKEGKWWQNGLECGCDCHLSSLDCLNAMVLVITHLHQDDVWVFSSLFSSQNLGGGWPQPIRELSKHISQRPHASSAVSPSLRLSPAIFFHSSFSCHRRLEQGRKQFLAPGVDNPMLHFIRALRPRLCPCHRNGHRQKTPPLSSSKFRFGRVKL